MASFSQATRQNSEIVSKMLEERREVRREEGDDASGHGAESRRVKRAAEKGVEMCALRERRERGMGAEERR